MIVICTAAAAILVLLFSRPAADFLADRFADDPIALTIAGVGPVVCVAVFLWVWAAVRAVEREGKDDVRHAQR